MGVDSNVLSDHLLEFVHSRGGGKVRRSFLQLICLLCVWVLWTGCNNKLFNNFVTHIPGLLDKVKYLTLGCQKAKKSFYVWY